LRLRVIARSNATKQSTFMGRCWQMDCFALLAMTVERIRFILKPHRLCYREVSTFIRRPHLAKAKRILKWQRDPEGMRLRILEAAKQEFATHGLAGARVDRIAAKAGANKRMLYYHVGKKDDLYLAVLEGAYEKIRVEERGLDLEHLDPPDAIERLIDFTWNYFLRNPEFLALLNTENLAKARHLKRSTKVKSMHSPFVEMIRTVVRRGVESGDFVVAVDPVQLYISIAALCFFYLSNSATLSVIFGRDLLSKEARDERLEHMVALVLAALTGKSAAAFGKNKMPKLRAPAQQPA
jgi:AcrR family transcriptional regulator